MILKNNRLKHKILQRLKPDDRGAALVLVLIAIGMVLILVSVLMSVSYLNYRMKVTEKKSKDSFYSAEVIMDQIHAGLEQVVSQAAGSAYTTALQTYRTGIYTESERTKNFRTSYLTAVRNSLQEGSSDSRYDAGTINSSYVSGSVTDANRPYTSGLATFLDDALQLTAYETAQGTNGTESLTISCTESGTSNSLVWSDEGLTLKSLLVQYTDPDGYYTEIQTDIRIGFPQVTLSESTVLPDVMDYAIVADQAIVFESGADATVSSSVYAGARTVTAADDTDTEQSILVDRGAKVTFDGADYIVAESDIDVEQGALTIRDGTLWANGIAVTGAGTKVSAQTSSTLSLDTTAYIRDDLTTSKYNITVDLNGKYYGYGDETAGRSAILINSANTALDLSGLDDLLLNGAAYINSKSVSTSQDGSDVLLGTSVAMKTDQIAFLAPTECLGTDEAGNVLIGQNPMNATDPADGVSKSVCQQWLTDTPIRLNVNKTVELLGYPLSHYGLTEKSYQTIYRTVGSERICYVYLQFDTEEHAAKYYRDYMAKANEQMKTYMSKYGNTITGLSGAVYSIRGNLLTYSLQNNFVAIVENTIDRLEAAEGAKFDTRVSKYKQSFSALCSKLTTNYTALTSDELTKSAYENIINVSELESLNDTLTYTAAGKKAVVADNKGGSALVVGSSSPSYADCALVVASGDVEIRGSFSGTILAGGTVTVSQTTGAKLEASRSVVQQLLQETDADGKVLVERFFVNGEQYALDQDGSDETEYISLESVISYVNWSKQ